MTLRVSTDNTGLCSKAVGQGTAGGAPGGNTGPEERQRRKHTAKTKLQLESQTAM